MKNKLTYEEKVERFLAKNGRERFRTKTELELLPIKMGNGSSSHHPEAKGGISTSDFKFWIKFLDGDWFIPYDFGNKEQILSLIAICNNDSQITSLMELLSAKREY